MGSRISTGAERTFSCPTMIVILSLVLTLLGHSDSHSMHSGQCPNFTPMSGFDWDKFSSGLWYVTQKFDTKSTCLTYEFKTDNLGFKSIEQINQIPYTNKLGIDNHYIYTGKLYTPQESKPANMIVRFPLSNFQTEISTSLTHFISRHHRLLQLRRAGHGLLGVRAGVHLPRYKPSLHLRSQEILLHPSQRSPGRHSGVLPQAEISSQQPSRGRQPRF